MYNLGGQATDGNIKGSLYSNNKMNFIHPNIARLIESGGSNNM